MSDIKFKEKDYAELLLKKGLISKNFGTELKILAKYFKSLGKKPKEREKLIYEFCENHVTDFSRVLYFKKINSALNYARKKESVLINIDQIEITKNELEVIDSLDADHVQKKLCFTLLTLNKLYSTIHKIKYGEKNKEHFYGGNNKKYKELIDVSHTSLTANKLHFIIGELAAKGIVEIRNKGFIKLSFIYEIDSDSEVAILINSFADIGLYYDLYTNQPKVKRCAACFVPLKMKSNKTKYCSKCAKDISQTKKNQWKRENWNKGRKIEKR
ncbi:hypothetical protein PF996_09010 [Bacillus velezensis]|nr:MULTISPECIES: hypothetical protein [Bacillus amyloliquefaciens group]MCR6616777.1 hypothetical protein [Bacillus amyloliquefaciens]QBG56638.1 hypothetical protein D2M30_2309 [Bacillus amyloliquefaciens]UBM47540.1 hypothetical protein LAZ98_09055 [Bacillus velezensis]WBY47528.1 hypothetical protein PF996_09010 [Bacillus velezensis]WJM64565.1 hypothetical protein QTN48_12085 [Bacillus velezensis]